MLEYNDMTGSNMVVTYWSYFHVLLMHKYCCIAVYSQQVGEEVTV
jgi:hypothetical protein